MKIFVRLKYSIDNEVVKTLDLTHFIFNFLDEEFFAVKHLAESATL
jgi:hypothetical protein